MTAETRPTAPTRRYAAVFAPNAFPSERAHVAAIVGMANAISARGFTTALYAFRRRDARPLLHERFALREDVELGWSWRDLSKIAKAASVLVWAIVAALKRHDLVLTRSPIIALAARRSATVIVELHQVPMTHFRRMMLDHQVIPRLKGNRYRFVFISNALKNIYLREFPHLQSSRSIVAPSGFRREWFPKIWSPSPGHRIVTYAGSLYQGRGIEVVVEVARRIPDAEFRIIGGSSATWQELTADLDVPPNCSHIPHVAPKAIAGYLTESDVLLAPYQRKVIIASGDDNAGVMSPLKLIEYFAAGRAIVASDLPAIREVADHSENALLVPPEDLTAWTTAVKELLSDRTRRDRLGEEAFRNAHGRLDWDSRLDAILGP